MCYLAGDVVAQNPDLVVVECSANDYFMFNGDQIPVGEARPYTQYRADQRAMEGVLRQLLSMGTPPGVILLGMVYGISDPPPTKNVPSSSLRPVSCTFQDRHLRVARYYSIPLVSYRDEYWPGALEAADPLMRTFYNHTDIPAEGDYVHPNATGHGKMADVITALLNTAKNAPATPSPSYSLPSQIFSSPGSYGTMTEVSANSHPGITVTIGQIGGVNTWSVTSANVHKFTSLLEEDDYTVANVWESTGGSGTNDDYWIQFTGIPKSEVIVEWSFGATNDHGKLRTVVNGDTVDPDIKQYDGSPTVGWTWVAFNLPNQSNTVKFIAKTSGKHCIIHRLWLTGSY